MNPKDYKKITHKKEQLANRSVAEFVNRVAPFDSEERRTVLDVSPRDCRNLKYLLWMGYHVIAYTDENTKAKDLQDLCYMRDALNDYEQNNAKNQKRPANPQNLRECEIVDRLSEIQFDCIIAIHALIDLPPIKLRYFVDYINDHTKPRGYLALTTRTTQQNPFPKWITIPDTHTKYTGKEDKRKTEHLDLTMMVIEHLLRKPRR